MRAVVVGLCAFAAMEPVTAATHRFVMHGVGIRLHRSHHRQRRIAHGGRIVDGRSRHSEVDGPVRHAGEERACGGRIENGRWEGNDAFPVLFASVVCIGMWVGFNLPGWNGLVPVGVGVTAYGAAYALVHDVYIHGRLRWFGDHHVAALDRLADAHALHHRFGAAPYGMLVPIVPSALRQRSSARPDSPAQRIVAAPRP